MSVTFVSFCCFPPVIFPFSLCSGLHPGSIFPRLDCHRLEEETLCSSAQPLVVSQAGRGVVPLSWARRDESQSLSSFSPLPGNGSPLGRVQAFAGKELSTVLTGRGWMREASGDPGRDLTGVLPRRSPPAPVPQPPPRGVGSATRTLALPAVPAVARSSSRRPCCRVLPCW